MKVFIHFEEPAAASLHQTLKITLPKKWETGPVSNLLDVFVKNYNEKHPENPMEASELRLETDMREVLHPNASVNDRINDRADLYVKIGATVEPPRAPSASAAYGGDPLDQQRACKLFGCNKKYTERDNFDGECQHHNKPPVFHETAKYWSCCPGKKAYDWESFMEIRGCARGKHSDIKPGGVSVMGGQELRGNPPGGAKLKSVDEFNRERNGEKSAAPDPIEALKAALVGVGCSAGDFDAAVSALKKKFNDDDAEVKAELATEFGFGLHNLIGTTGSGPPPPRP